LPAGRMHRRVQPPRGRESDNRRGLANNVGSSQLAAGRCPSTGQAQPFEAI
jgi:hypothetical protein